MGMPMSRQPRSGSAGKPRAVRATDDEFAQWQRAAAAEQCPSLSAWVVKTLNARAMRVTRDGRKER